MTEPAKPESAASLAINGGPKAFTGKCRPFRPQIGLEEFLALARRFGLGPEALERIHAAVSAADLPEDGVFLGRFGHPRPDETEGAKFEALARATFGVPHARAVSSGTGALHAGFVGVGVGPGTLEAAIDVVQLGKLGEVVARFRAVSRRIRTQLRQFKEVRLQKSNDEEGWIGYQIALLPKSVELGRKIAAALKAEGIPAHCRGLQRGLDWHCAADTLPVSLTQGHTPGGSVFEDPRYLARGGKAPAYGRGTCPVAEDLWTRGVYFWVDQWWTPADCDAVAAAIHKVLSAYCTPADARKAPP
ncbi:MAG: hypothetical protein FJ288_16590 [Planctomycetes bacterium]|nr:hypothetical protein [Planctomycetota bacterium]